MRLIAVRRESGRSPLEAYRDGLCAVLCSPGFLYLDEPGDTLLDAYRWPRGCRISYGPRCPTRRSWTWRRAALAPTRTSWSTGPEDAGGTALGRVHRWVPRSLAGECATWDRCLPTGANSGITTATTSRSRCVRRRVCYAALARQQSEHRELPRFRLHFRRRAAGQALRTDAAPGAGFAKIP